MSAEVSARRSMLLPVLNQRASSTNISSIASVAGVRCETGVFQAMMEVELVNSGPVTILIDSRKQF